MRNLFYILVFLVFAVQSHAQESNQFDFQIQRIDSVSYNMTLDITNVENVRAIKITIKDSGNMINEFNADLNKKRNGNYYLFYQNVDVIVSLNEIPFSFNHNPPDFDYGMLENPSVLVELFDIDLVLLEAYQKTID